MAKKTICFDFDGVIHSYVSGWKGSPTIIPDPPVKGIEKVLAELNKDYILVIQSTRSKTEAGTNAVWDWLKKYNLDKYISNIYPTKPPACLYIDDRGICFNGNCDMLLEQVKNFTWYLDKENND